MNQRLGYTSKKRLRFLRWFHHFLGHQTSTEEEKKRGISILMDFIVFLFSLPRTKETWIWILCSVEDDEWVKALLNNEYAMPAFLPCHMNHPLSSKTNEKYIESVICVLKHWRIFFFISYCFTFLPFKLSHQGFTSRELVSEDGLSTTRNLTSWPEPWKSRNYLVALAINIFRSASSGSREARRYFFCETKPFFYLSREEKDSSGDRNSLAQAPGRSIVEQKGQRHNKVHSAYKCSVNFWEYFGL